MSTLASFADVRQTVVGWLRNTPALARAARQARESVATDTPASPGGLNESTLNFLLMALFSQASRVDSFGNFR